MARGSTRKPCFFDTESYLQSTLAEQLGGKFTKKGGIQCDHYEATDVPGLSEAGNILKNLQLVIVAASEYQGCFWDQ
jgi:pyruvate/2-oxoglutarate dehydrogenase complex dihydrolipoamide dehydrogenase (E3) component